MSYLDFSLYSEKIYKLYEDDEKRKLEEKKNKYDAMNANFQGLANSFSFR